MLLLCCCCCCYCGLFKTIINHFCMSWNEIIIRRNEKDIKLENPQRATEELKIIIAQTNFALVHLTYLILFWWCVQCNCYQISCFILFCYNKDMTQQSNSEINFRLINIYRINWIPVVLSSLTQEKVNWMFNLQVLSSFFFKKYKHSQKSTNCSLNSIALQSPQKLVWYKTTT